MTARNIGGGVHYLKVPEHPYYRQTIGWGPEDYPRAISISRQRVSHRFQPGFDSRSRSCSRRGGIHRRLRLRLPRNLLHSLGLMTGRSDSEVAGVEYWDRRARQYGARSVLNLGHLENEVARATQVQKDRLIPLFKGQLAGDEGRVLDFGCGPGRFSAALAEATGGSVLGVDPVAALLALAPAAERVEYQLITEAHIPCADQEFDAIWCCLVMGGITSFGMFDATVAELSRVLRHGGLLFLVENTAKQPNAPHWHFRSVAEYARLFGFVNLAHLADYEDLGETISVMAGRKR